MGTAAGANEAMTGVILAGGRSTRFGSDKASALLAGRPLLQWVAEAASGVCQELVVVRARGQELPHVECDVPVRMVDDVFEAKGPLAGLVAGFRATERGLAAAVACDAPLIQPGLIAAMAGAMEGADAVCGRVEGRLQPLPAVCRVESCLPVFEARVAAGLLAVQGALDDLNVRLLEEADLRAVDRDLLSYRAPNTPAALAELEQGLDWLAEPRDGTRSISGSDPATPIWRPEAGGGVGWRQ